ncbi:MAG: DnaD domain protein [Acidobacteriota bacterium]
MFDFEPGLELFRWGFVQTPAILYCYATELDLDMEDLGLFGAVFYAFASRSKPLYRTGVEIGQIMQVCPIITKQRLARKITKWEKAGLVAIEGSNQVEFSSRKMYIEPLYVRLREIIVRDHPEFKPSAQNNEYYDSLFADYDKRIEQMQIVLQDEKANKRVKEFKPVKGQDVKKVSDFISKKTGNLTSGTLEKEVRKWLEEYRFKLEFILCMLELCFERKITHPRELAKIAKGLKECSINNLEGMENYLKNFVDGSNWPKISGFDPEVINFGNFTGIDMNAEARKKVYYKWRYDWGFTGDIIKKAGEIMCSRTRSGGLEYIDSVLNDWKERGLRNLPDVEREMDELKKSKKEDKRANVIKKSLAVADEEREIYIPPTLLDNEKVSSR